MIEQADGLVVLLAVAILVAELFPVEIPDGDGEVSFSTTFAFALLLTDGVAAVVLVHALALAIADLVRRRPLERLVFNVAQYAICWAVAGGLLVALTGDLPDENGLQYLELRYVPALVATAAVFLAINTVLASTPPALQRGTSPLRMVRSDLLLNTWWTVVLVALVPGILVASDYSLWLLPLIGIPLVAIQLGSRQAVINEHEARHDRVTGLSNREDVARVLEHALHRAGRQDAQVGVLMVGLSRFKEINETLGHRRGDLVLIEVARRLTGIARPSDVAARLGGDEFAVILTPVDGVAGCIAAAERALDALRAPVMIRGVALDLEAHAGIACHPEHGDTYDALLRHADVALEQAKASHREALVYSSEFDEHGVERLTLVSDLSQRDRRRRARARLPAAGRARDGAAAGGRGAGALVASRARRALAGGVHRARRADRRDPVADAVGGGDGAQPGRALARGRARRPRRGQPVAALDHARAAARPRADPGRPHARRWSSRSPRRSAWWTPTARSRVLEELTALGIRLSVDDFGTGFSSLAYLKQLPVSAIKIDRSFVMEMDHEASDRAIVHSTVDLARHLGMEVVAEGVESQEALEELRALGCHLAQGYAISPPLGADALAAWAEAARAR